MEATARRMMGSELTKQNFELRMYCLGEMSLNEEDWKTKQNHDNHWNC